MFIIINKRTNLAKVTKNMKSIRDIIIIKSNEDILHGGTMGNDKFDIWENGVHKGVYEIKKYSMQELYTGTLIFGELEKVTN